MLKKYIIASLFVIGCAQASVLEEMSKKVSPDEFTKFFAENRSAVAQESNVLSLTLTFVKDEATSQAAWNNLLQHFVETMSLKNRDEFLNKISEVMYDEEIAAIHGRLEAKIGAYEQNELPTVADEVSVNNSSEDYEIQ